MIILLLFLSNVFAQDYYADLSFNVDETGIVDIMGVSNHPSLAEGPTEAFTSKKGSYWLFNLSIPKNDSFSDYVYSITLPEGSQVNYVKTKEGFRITGTGDQIKISGAGSGELNILIQYSIENSKKPYIDYMIPLVGLLFFLLAVGFFLRKKQKKLPEELQELSEILSERQKDIFKIISESEKPINQTSICDKLNLPKSSVSRNINSLEKLGLVEKTRVGMSTYILLKKK